MAGAYDGTVRGRGHVQMSSDIFILVLKPYYRYLGYLGHVDFSHHGVYSIKIYM